MSWYRLKDEGTGHEYTAWSDDGDFLNGITVLDKPATDPRGRPLPPKPRINLESLQDTRTEKTVDAMTVPELHDYASRNSIDLADATTKAAILERIAQHHAQDPVT